MKTKVIAICNQKGGVAKTTSAVTLGYGLSYKGFGTLIVDTDPQGHIAFSFGLEKTPGFYRLIVEEEALSSVVLHARTNLDIVPGDKRSEKVKRYVAGLDYREAVLSDIFVDTNYDVILIDTAPSLDVLHVAALVTADWVLIPTKLDAMAVDGVNEILKSYAEVMQHGGHIQGYTFLPTFFERVTRETVLQLRELVNAFGSHVWPPIPADTKAREAVACGQTLWEYAPNTPAIVGSPDGHKLIGGYAQALERLVKVIHA
jgi:chromosome partitioning protein